MKMYLRTFAPWIVFAIVSSFAGWRPATAAGLAAAVLVLAAQGRAARSDLLGMTTLGYFAVMTAVALAFPQAGIHRYLAALSFAVLGLVSWASLAARRPFTLHFARQQTPAEFWERPAFYRINAVITAVWAASFVITAAACGVSVAAGVTALAVVFEVAGFAVPAVFTARYPAYAQARLARPAG